jgi:hypothetical protein
MKSPCAAPVSTLWQPTATQVKQGMDLARPNWSPNRNGAPHSLRVVDFPFPQKQYQE